MIELRREEGVLIEATHRFRGAEVVPISEVPRSIGQAALVTDMSSHPSMRRSISAENDASGEEVLRGLVENELRRMSAQQLGDVLKFIQTERDNG